MIDKSLNLGFSFTRDVKAEGLIENNSSLYLVDAMFLDQRTLILYKFLN